MSQFGIPSVTREEINALISDSVNVSDFGAWDGVSDDTDAIVAAFAAVTSDKQRVIFSKPHYRVSSMITVPSCSIIGNNTIIGFYGTNPASTSPIFLISSSNTKVSGLTFDCRSVDTYTKLIGLKAYNVTNVDIENCSFKGSYNQGLLIDTCSIFTISNVKATACSRGTNIGNIEVTNSSQGIIDNVIVYDSSGKGVLISESEDIITSNLIASNMIIPPLYPTGGAMGYNANLATRVTLTNFSITKCAEQSFKISTSCKDVKISNGICDNNYSDLTNGTILTLEGCSKTKISNVDFYMNTYSTDSKAIRINVSSIGPVAIDDIEISGCKFYNTDFTYFITNSTGLIDGVKKIIIKGGYIENLRYSHTTNTADYVEFSGNEIKYTLSSLGAVNQILAVHFVKEFKFESNKVTGTFPSNSALYFLYQYENAVRKIAFNYNEINLDLNSTGGFLVQITNTDTANVIKLDAYNNDLVLSNLASVFYTRNVLNRCNYNNFNASASAVDSNYYDTTVHEVMRNMIAVGTLIKLTNQTVLYHDNVLPTATTETLTGSTATGTNLKY